MTRQDSLNWEDIKIFRDKWPGILMIKGINRPDDALKAIEYGVDGIVVSNHGGRNMDSVVATHRRAAGDRRGGGRSADGHPGFRRAARLGYRQGAGAGCEGGADRTRHAVRHGGRRQAGAFKAINLIRNELDKTMAYTGCRSVDEVTTDIFFGGRQGNRLFERVMDEAAF